MSTKSVVVMSDPILPISSGAIMLTLIIVSTMLLFTIAAVIILYSYFQKLFANHDAQLRMIQDDLAAICNGAVGVGGHLARLEEQTRSLLQRQEQLEMQEAPEQSYRQAIRMVRSGADINQLISDCGLAQGEAELAMLAGNLDRKVS